MVSTEQVRLGERLNVSTRASTQIEMTAAGRRILEHAPAFLQIASAMRGPASLS